MVDSSSAPADRIELLRFTLGAFQENAYVLVGPSGARAVVVDPGLEAGTILQAIERRGLAVELIVNTHGHLDHAAGNALFKERTGAPLAIHAADAPWLTRLQTQGAAFGIPVEDSPEPDRLLADGERIAFDGAEIEVIHTPGHSPGGVCLRFGRRMLTGDTLFEGSIGRTDLPGGSFEDLARSIRTRLFTLPDDTVCYPGHGEETTIGRERRTNPFVGERA